MRMVETVCTSQSPCLRGPAPPIGSVLHPWNICGPIVRSRPILSPRGGNGTDGLSEHGMNHQPSSGLSVLLSNTFRPGKWTFLKSTGKKLKAPAHTSTRTPTHREYYLKHLALRTLVKEQVLLVERLQSLSCNLGFLFGFTSSIIQQVHLDIRSWG